MPRVNHDKSEWPYWIVGGLIIVGILLWSLVAPYFEAKTFNRCTSSNATYFDAVFTQLGAKECKR